MASAGGTIPAVKSSRGTLPAVPRSKVLDERREHWIKDGSWKITQLSVQVT